MKHFVWFSIASAFGLASCFAFGLDIKVSEISDQETKIDDGAVFSIENILELKFKENLHFSMVGAGRRFFLNGSGTYKTSAGVLVLKFNDGSEEVLKIKDGGKRLKVKGVSEQQNETDWMRRDRK